jgi:E3 ubiquitin-protein ligase HUWE1
LQLLNLLEVIIDNAENKTSLSDKSEAATEQPSGPQNSSSDADMNTEVGATTLGVAGSSSAQPTSGANSESDAQIILLNLPQAELRLLCSLLAREGYDITLICFSMPYVVLVLIDVNK